MSARLSVCLYVCMYVCIYSSYMYTITCESFDVESSFVFIRYILREYGSGSQARMQGNASVQLPVN